MSRRSRRAAPRIDWKPITDLPVDSHNDAVEKLRWYAMHWKIEVFHKILKSGGRAEQARLRTAGRLVRLLAVFCILSWRVFWLTMLNRTEPDLEPALVPTEIEIKVLDHLIPDPAADPSPARTLSLYLIKIARLGGYLARAKDPPPSYTTSWDTTALLPNVDFVASSQCSPTLRLRPTCRFREPAGGVGNRLAAATVMSLAAA